MDKGKPVGEQNGGMEGGEVADEVGGGTGEVGGGTGEDSVEQ